VPDEQVNRARMTEVSPALQKLTLFAPENFNKMGSERPSAQRMSL